MELQPHPTELVQPKKRVTLSDLAKELGLSDRAVSQALNPRASNVKLSVKTIERVRELAERRNYRRDFRARSMRYGRFYSIGYFEGKRSLTSWPLLGAESGVFDEANERDYQIVLVRLPSPQSGEAEKIPTILREANLDALILSHAGDLSKDLEKVIDASEFPLIYLNEKKPQNAVYVDEVDGAMRMTEHLIQQGYEKIGYYGESTRNHYSSGERIKGYKRMITKHGRPPLVLERYRKDSIPFNQWITSAEGIDAVICYNDLTALHVFRYLYDTPLKVPTDLALTGFGDDFANDCCPIGLSTMRMPFYEMGRAAVDMALELINSGKSTIPSRVFKQELIIRESTRAKQR